MKASEINIESVIGNEKEAMGKEVKIIEAIRPSQFFEFVALWYLDNFKEYIKKIGKFPQQYLREGRDENKEVKGLLCVSDGKTLERLKNDRLIIKNFITDFTTIKNSEDFLNYMRMLDKENHLDGALIYDGEKCKIAKAPKIFLNGRKIEEIIEKKDIRNYVPEDFICLDCSINPSYETIGTKTQTAFWLPLPEMYPDVNTIAIRQTAYGKTKFGTLIEFDKNGLKHRMFLDIMPSVSYKGPFIDEKNNVIAILDSSFRNDGRVVFSKRNVVYVKDGGLYYEEMHHEEIKNKEARNEEARKQACFAFNVPYNTDHNVAKRKQLVW
ncbi:MAG: hypothetical protein N3D84_03020 [Candidatus Woesearchaeota archaeon]|nr:hypothetical protein [Candidatus Woesearchaeota archaeon]